MNLEKAMANPPCLERLAPSEIEARLAAAPILYLPCAPLEWHGPHLPVGLDGLVAHGACVRAAAKTGGLVMPTFWLATGGGHGAYPYTAILPREVVEPAVRALVVEMLRWRPRLIVIFSGHFPNEQRDLGQAVAHALSGKAGEVLSLCALDWTASPVRADHAGLFETLLLGAMSPELVHTDKLPGSSPLEETNPYGPQRHDPAHPLYGIFGADPRGYTPEAAAQLLDGLVDWLAGTVAARMTTFSG
jgi:creatinine amidohydrolase